MATLQELEQALVGAHRAGDLDAARKLAVAVKAARSDVGAQIPGAQVALPSSQPQPGLIDQAIGTGEAALSTVTGLTGGTIGMIGGTLKGLAEQILSGKFGTPEAAKLVEQAASQGAQALTYAPRTQAGQEQTQAVGQAMQQLLPAIAAAPGLPMGSLASALPVARVGAAAVLDKAATAMPGAMQRAAQMMPGAGKTAAAGVEMPAVQLAQTARSAVEGGIGSASAAKVLAEQAAPDSAIVKSAERLGVGDYLQPDHTTTSEAYRQVVAAIKSNPQSAVALAEREGLARLAERAAKLVDEAGGTGDLSEMSQRVKHSLEATQAALDSKADMLYGQLREGVPARAQVEAPNVLAFVEQRARDLGGEENLSSMERMILRKLKPKEAAADDARSSGSASDLPQGQELMARSAQVAEEAPSAVRTGGPTYALLDDVRRDLTAAKYKRQGPFKDADTGLIKKLEVELMKDQRAAIEPYGMLDVFDAARSAVRARKGIEDDLSALFGKALDRTVVAGGAAGVGGAMSALAKGDSGALARLLKHVPDDLRQHVVASGLSTVFRKTATRGELDFTGFSKWYEGLRRNRQAYAAVMSNLPLESRKQVEALYRVSKGVSESLNRRIKTGALNTIKQEMMGGDGLMDGLYSMARRAGAGMAAEAVTTPLGLPGAGLSAAIASALTKGKPQALQSVDALIASPEFAHLVRTQAGTRERSVAARLVARSAAFKRFVRSVGNPSDMSDAAGWILRSMQQAANDPQHQNDRRKLGETH